MSVGIRKRIKNWSLFAVAVCLIATIVVNVHAAQDIPVMEQYINKESISLYLKYAGETQNVEAQIGTEVVDEITITDSKSIPIVTWLLLDNSHSIGDTDRVKSKELLTNLVAGRAENERFNLCTYDEHLKIILQDSQDYTEIKNQIDAITNNDQKSYLTDVLVELLDIESSREEPAYVRVVVIGDGVDENSGGLTRAELNDRLSQQKIPIYTLGCETSNNALLLKDLYSLSRQTSAQSWSLSALTDTLAVVKAMGNEEIPICATISIPEKLRDGGIKGIQVAFSDGSTAKTQATMPFGQEEETISPVPIQETDPAPQQQELSTKFLKSLPFLVGGIILLIGVIVLAVFLVKRRRKCQQIRPVVETSGPGEDATDILTDTYEDADNSNTLPLFGADHCAILRLSNLAHPDQHFEAPLRGRVAIGRSDSNQIILSQERSVSGTHCEIYAEGNIWKIRDIHSSNGTYVNGTRITDAVEIASGSVIKLGRMELLVEIR